MHSDYEAGLDLESRQKRLHYLKARRDFRRFQIYISRLRFFVRITAIFFLIWGLNSFLKLPQWYLADTAFTNVPNTSIMIEGNSIIKTAQVLTMLKSVKLAHKPVYMMNTDPVKKALMKLSPVEKVYIQRFWFPARLRVVIEEKIPLLAIAPKPNVTPIAVFTEDASIIKREFLPLKNSSKTRLVLTYADYSKWSLKHIKYLSYLINMIEQYSDEKVQYLDMRNPDDVFVQLNTVKVRVGEFNETVFKRLKRVSSVLPQTKDLDSNIDYVDLRWDDSTFIKLKGKFKNISDSRLQINNQ